MADNILLSTNIGCGQILATDCITCVQYQIVKLSFGALNTATAVTTSAPLPIDIRASNATITVDMGANNDVTINASSMVIVDDAAFTPATTAVMMAGFEFDDTTPDSVDEGDAGAARMSANRNIYTTIRDAAGNERGANVNSSNEVSVRIAATGTPAIISNSGADGVANTTNEFVTGAHMYGYNCTTWDRLRIDGCDNLKVVAINAGTFAVQIVDTSFAVADGNALGEGVLIQGDDGTDRKNINVDATTGDVQVDITHTVTVASHAVTNAGTFAVQVDGDALTALQLIDNVVVTEDAAAAANPTGNVMMSVRDDEVGSTALTTADNDLQALRSNKFGELKVTQVPDSTSEFKYAIIDAASSGNNTIQAAAGCGVKIRVLAAFLVSAGTVNTRFESAADGTALTGQMNLVANTGFVLPFNPAGWFETADNALLNLELSAGVSVDGSITYVEI